MPRRITSFRPSGLRQERVPDAIVLDIGLPGIDGVFYLNRLRESARTSAVPIVMISSSDAARADAERAGAAAFVRKPFDPLDLLAILERAMGDPPLAHAFRPGLTETEADGDAADVRRLIEIAHHQHEVADRAYRETVTALATALESRASSAELPLRARLTSPGMRLAVESPRGAHGRLRASSGGSCCTTSARSAFPTGSCSGRSPRST